MTRERRWRVREERTPRHRAINPVEGFKKTFTALGELALTGAQVSASVVDIDSGETLVAIDDRVVLPMANVGKVLLLVEIAARISSQGVQPLGILEKSSAEVVRHAGVWQHLQAPALPIHDIATLVGATGDNLATNVLLKQVGLDAVHERADGLGLRRTALLDRARDTRGPDDAPQFSVGSAAELTRLFLALARGQVVDQATSSRVLGWLSLNADLSMVASSFGLDPLAHRDLDHGLMLVNTTGTDDGVRADVGVLRGPRAGLAYAVLAKFEDSGVGSRLRVTDAMRVAGLDLLEYVY